MAQALLRDDAWNIGIGLGELDEPLPAHTRAGRGAAYLHARTAVTAAKGSPLARAGRRRGRGVRPGVGERAVALGGSARTDAPARAGRWPTWSTIGLTYDEDGQRKLGITQSAVTQRARAAGLVEGRRALELTRHLAAEHLGEGLMNGWIVATVLLAAIVPVAVAGWGWHRGRACWPAWSSACSPWPPRWPSRCADPIDDQGRAGPGRHWLRRWWPWPAAGPVTAGVFSARGRRRTPRPSARSPRPGEVLRGGAWIGALERARRPGAAARRLARGPGRRARPEGAGPLPRAAGPSTARGAAERFIIGTFASVLWAAACAGVASALG